MGSPPWNNWYHVTIHTYGSWLRGDPRGWRSRHHRQHVDGDYRHPPPKGKHTTLHDKSKSLMTREPIKIPSRIRQFIANAFAQKLISDQIEVLIISVDATHLHLLARFPAHNPRHYVGRAKKHTSHSLRQSLMTSPTPTNNPSIALFAKRSHATPITDRSHQLNTFAYILSHSTRGAQKYGASTTTK